MRSAPLAVAGLLALSSAFAVACSDAASAPTAGDADGGLAPTETPSGNRLPTSTTPGATPGATPVDPRAAAFKLDVQRTRIGGGADYTCALMDSGAVKCWGRNDKGQLGIGDTKNRGDAEGEMGDRLPAVNLGNGKKAFSVSVGWYHACALLEEGAVKCWGANDAGQAGQGDNKHRGDGANEMGEALPAIALGTTKRVVAISAGGYHACALLEDGAVKCWGANGYGQLGLGDMNHRGDQANEMGDKLAIVELGKRAVGISAGNLHTCAVLEDGSAKCWGNGADGQLGLGTVGPRGFGAGQMGDKLPAIDLGAGRGVKSIAAGGFHTCAVLDDGAVKCWGISDVGQHGQGDTARRGDKPDQMGDKLPKVDLGAGRKATALSTLYDHTCAILDDASVKCWGWNKEGQLGLGDRRTRGDNAGEMGDALPRVALGNGRRATQLGIGWDHSCALLDDGAFKCWGLNWAGHLGLGDTHTRGDTAASMGDALPAVKLTGQ